MNHVTRLVAAAILAMGIAARASAQGDGYVGIYADAQGTIACTSIPQGTAATLYAVAKLAGASQNGITGVEFRIEVSNPAGWMFSFQPASGSVPIGNVFDVEPANPDDASGVNLAFSSCRGDTTGQVLLGAIMAYNSTGGGTSLSVKRHSHPPNPAYTCPLFTLCDVPVYSKLCMSPGSAPPCDLSKSIMLGASDPAVFVAGLNVIPGDGEGGGGESRPMILDPIVRAPLIVANPTEPDVIGIDGFGGMAKAGAGAQAATDTTWIGDWDFDGAPGACDSSGRYNDIGPTEPWTSEDNYVRNDSPSFWNRGTHYDNVGYIVDNAAELRLEGCWANTGYGNSWDQAVKLKYKGSGATLSFDFLSDSEPGEDFVTVEADSADSSNDRVQYDPVFGTVLWPEEFRREIYKIDGPQLTGQVTTLQLPCFGLPDVEHSAWIRFHSNHSGSDEDGEYLTAIDAGLVVDNIEVTGALSYSEDFEGTILNPNVLLVNSDRSKSFGVWGRLFSHVTDNDNCIETENTTCSWLFSDPQRSAFFPDMAFGPGSAVLRNWLDNTITSPWISLNPLDESPRLVVSFREFGANRYQNSRIMRAVGIRGLYEGTCTTDWRGEEEKIEYGNTWYALDSFNWVTHIYDMSRFFDPLWEKIQVRFRVADWQALFHASPPNPHNPGPGPYIDRVRIGRVALAGPYIYVGPDTRYQAQDAFPTSRNAISPGEHFSPSTDRFGPCAFSMAYDLGIPPDPLSPGSPNLITGDSIIAAVTDLSGGGIRRVGFYFRVVSGPHRGRKGADEVTLLENGLCKEDKLYDPPIAASDFEVFHVDFNDTYFRGGDVVHYFWFAENEAHVMVSYPPGITEEPDAPGFSIEKAELLTGGLLEVSFLPTIDWDPGYLANVAADPDSIGDVDPTPEEIANSTQANCFLYVNKVNTARRTGSANRTSFMYTLDRLGYRGHYDVYDVQGFGNTNNDLGGRATMRQVEGYSLIVHDVGRSSFATIPDGSDLSTLKVNQAQWYRDYLAQGNVSLAGSATLWVIGENWAFENPANPLVSSDMLLSQVENDIRRGANPAVLGQSSFTFVNGAVAFFAGDEFALSGGCPYTRTYDGLTSSAVVTHRYAQSSGPGAVVMNKYGPLKWNTIAMGFNWFDIRDEFGGTPQSGVGTEATNLARKILNGVLPVGCQRGEGPTDVGGGDLPADAPPLVTALHQNMPNPFNPWTVIAFDLAEEENVRLRVYDIAGHLVRRLIEEKQPRGRQTVVWDGADDSGHRVSTGIYLYRLEVGSFTATRKLLVLK